MGSHTHIHIIYIPKHAFPVKHTPLLLVILLNEKQCNISLLTQLVVAVTFNAFHLAFHYSSVFFPFVKPARADF